MKLKVFPKIWELLLLLPSLGESNEVTKIKFTFLNEMMVFRLDPVHPRMMLRQSPGFSSIEGIQSVEPFAPSLLLPARSMDSSSRDLVLIPFKTLSLLAFFTTLF